MEDSENEVMTSVKEESGKGWTWLYLTVVAALFIQIALFAWLSKTFG